MISFVISGAIGGKGRPRVAVRGKFATVYTPTATRNMEAMVRDLGSKAMAGKPPLEGPLRLSIRLTKSPAQSWSKKRKASEKWVTGKPDVDNIVKLLGDALNAIIWHDDSQIASLDFERQYSLTEQERVEIAVTPLG